MPLPLLTLGQLVRVVRQLACLGRTWISAQGDEVRPAELALNARTGSLEGVVHSDGTAEMRTHELQYASLMGCFLMHNLSAAEALLALHDSLGVERFPVTVGYGIARSMLEVDITAHYITQSPADRAGQYIRFGHVLEKREMDTCAWYMAKSPDPRSRESLAMEWDLRWSKRQPDVDAKYEDVRDDFETVSARGKRTAFRNWSGKRISDMAKEVDHGEAYDVFYAHLCSFVHADVALADTFVRTEGGRLSLSLTSGEDDVFDVFWYAGTFLTCYLKLFGVTFGVWRSEDVDACWDSVKPRAVWANGQLRELPQEE